MSLSLPAAAAALLPGLPTLPPLPLPGSQLLAGALQLVTFQPTRSFGGGASGIGPFTHQVTIREAHRDELVVTDHPVEQGANIADHAYRVPSEVVLELGWSDSSLSGATFGITTGSALPPLLLDLVSLASGGAAGGPGSYVKYVYSQLLALQQTRIPFDIITGKRRYQNMLFTSLSVETDQETETALFVQARAREVLITQTSATTLPPTANQAFPNKTQELTDSGSKQLTVPDTTPQVGAFANAPAPLVSGGGGVFAGHGASGTW